MLQKLTTASCYINCISNTYKNNVFQYKQVLFFAKVKLFARTESLTKSCSECGQCNSKQAKINAPASNSSKMQLKDAGHEGMKQLACALQQESCIKPPRGDAVAVNAMHSTQVYRPIAVYFVHLNVQPCVRFEWHSIALVLTAITAGVNTSAAVPCVLEQLHITLHAVKTKV